MKKYKVLARVTDIFSDHILVIIQAWCSKRKVKIIKNKIPQYILKELKVDYYMNVMANISHDDVLLLDCSNFELLGDINLKDDK